jgi:hypothetical protein
MSSYDPTGTVAAAAPARCRVASSISDAILSACADACAVVAGLIPIPMAMAAICAAYASIPPPFLASSFVVATEAAAAAAWRVAAPADHLNANASDDRQLFERRRRRRGRRGRRRVGGAARADDLPGCTIIVTSRNLRGEE